MRVILIVALLMLVGAFLHGCAAGPNEKPVWRAYSLDIKE